MGDTVTEDEYALDRVGAKVLVVSRGDQFVRVATVTRIGRRWATATVDEKWPREYEYEIATGHARPHRDGIGEPRYDVHTPDSLAAYQRREALEQRLRHFVRAPGWIARLDVEQLQTIVEIIEPGG